MRMGREMRHAGRNGSAHADADTRAPARWGQGYKRRVRDASTSGYAAKVAVARTVPVVVTSRAPVSWPLVTGSGLPQ
jgi:hypothetical protein